MHWPQLCLYLLDVGVLVHCQLSLPAAGVLDAEVIHVAIAEPGRDDVLYHHGLGEAEVEVVALASVRLRAPQPDRGIAAAHQVLGWRHGVFTAGSDVPSGQQTVVV